MSTRVHHCVCPQLVCTWLRQLTSACVVSGAGVLPLELEHMKERYRLYRPMDPSPEKTLMASGQRVVGGRGQVGPLSSARLCCARARLQTVARLLARQRPRQTSVLPRNSCVPPAAAGRANPDFTKRLKWQPVAEVAFKDLSAQVTLLLRSGNIASSGWRQGGLAVKRQPHAAVPRTWPSATARHSQPDCSQLARRDAPPRK
jgi:hypothetical protein